MMMIMMIVDQLIDRLIYFFPSFFRSFVHCVGVVQSVTRMAPSTRTWPGQRWRTLSDLTALTVAAFHAADPSHATIHTDYRSLNYILSLSLSLLLSSIISMMLLSYLCFSAAALISYFCISVGLYFIIVTLVVVPCILQKWNENEMKV